MQVDDLASNAVATPTNTITLRLDRTQPFLSALLVWPFTGAGPTVASLTLDVSQRMVGAGTPSTLLPVALDAAGAPAMPTPAVSDQFIVKAVGISGTSPTVVNGQVITADTRGGYAVRATLAGKSLQASARFTVIQSGSQSGNAGLYSIQSTAQSTVQRQLTLASNAVQSGDSAALSAAAAIAAAGANVRPVKLSDSTAWPPDLGCVPDSAKPVANGIRPVAADAACGNTTAQLRSKLAQLTTFLNQAPANDASDAAALVQHQTELAAILGTLRSSAGSPSEYGVVQHADNISDLLAKDMPVLLKALAARTQAQVNLQSVVRGAAVLGPVGAAGKAAALGAANVVDRGVDSGADSGAITTVISKMGPIGELVVAIYGDFIDQIENRIVILTINHLLDMYVPRTLTIEGIVSGAALLGPYAYHYPDRCIDLSGVS